MKMCDKNKLEKAKLALLSMQRYSWEQGVSMQAFLEAGDYDIVIAMAKEAAYRQGEDGRLASIGSQSGVTDPCACGEGLLYAISVTGDETLKTAHEKCLNWALKDAPRNPQGIVYHMDDSKQFWADTIYMLPPYLAASGEYQEAVRQIRGNINALLDKNAGLMRHKWDDETNTYPRKDFWGVGNGWTIAGIARVINMLPSSMTAEKEELIGYAKTIINGLFPYLRDDGMFHDVVNDGHTFIEVNCSQMLAYTLYRGMKAGWLSKDYLVSAEKLRKAAQNCVDSYGRVCPVCGAPHFDRAGSAPEGNAFYILMETAAEDFL